MLGTALQGAYDFFVQLLIGVVVKLIPLDDDPLRWKIYKINTPHRKTFGRKPTSLVFQNPQ